MNYSTYRFTLDLRKHESQMSIAVFTNDTAVRLCISLTDGGIPYHVGEGCRAVLYGKRPDDSPLIHNCMIDDTGRIIYDFNEHTASQRGITRCHIRLYGTDGELISAPRFIIVAEDGLVTDEDLNKIEDPLGAIDGLFVAEREMQSSLANMQSYIETSLYSKEDANKAFVKGIAGRDGVVIKKDISIAASYDCNYVDDETQAFTITSALPIKPGSLIVDNYAQNKYATDDGEGHFILDGEKVGSINYETGECSGAWLMRGNTDIWYIPDGAPVIGLSTPIPTILGKITAVEKSINGVEETIELLNEGGVE